MKLTKKQLRAYYANTLPEIDAIETATHKYITIPEIKEKILRQTQAVRSVISKIS